MGLMLRLRMLEPSGFHNHSPGHQIWLHPEMLMGPETESGGCTRSIGLQLRDISWPCIQKLGSSPCPGTFKCESEPGRGHILGDRCTLQL